MTRQRVRTSVLVFLLYIRTFLSVAADLLFLNGDDLVPASEIGPFKVSDVTVSGISSGGFMAVQLHIAFSSIINGSATFAAGPYYCAENLVASAELKCMKILYGLPDTGFLVEITKEYERTNLIDHVANLIDDRIYIFSGKDDSVVNPAVVNALQTYYQFFAQPYNIVADYSFPAEHCFPTLDYGEECTTLSSPYIGKCQFDGAKAAFKTLFGALKSSTSAIPKNLFKFDQRPFWVDSLSSLDDFGYLYLPTKCQSSNAVCRLHISLHGCEQTQDLIGNDYATKTGLNDWAEANDIIVVYPYAKRSPSVPLNPNGCWDWWGYTNAYYATNRGKQMRFIRNLIAALSGL